MSHADDVDLVQQCLEGDARAFELLLARYESQVFNVVLRMVHDYDDALDTTQTVFVKVFENLSKFDSRHKLFSWIYRIAINESLNLISRRNRGETATEFATSGEWEVGSSEHHAASARRDLNDALSRLKPDYRSVIILKHILGCSYRDIANILKVPEKTIKSRLFSARDLLRKMLLNQNGQDES
jgi:RNA polymerase sigma-70 factor (ECF subfamily)